MTRFQLAKLIALMGFMLYGCSADLGYRSGVKPSVPEPSDGFGSTPSGKSDTYLDRWKSCVRLLTSNNDLEATELQAMFESPKVLEQLLLNLKMAWDKQIPVQAEFFNESVLERFFGGSEVRRIDVPARKNIAGVKLIVSHFGSDTSQRMTATIESSCMTSDGRETDNSPTKSAWVHTSIVVEAGHDSTIHLGAVRSIFGPEAESDLDRGVSPHGYTYAPTYKGKVVYYGGNSVSPRDLDQSKRILIYLKLDEAGSGFLNRDIGDQDVVERLEMNVEHDQKWRNP